MKLEYIVYLVKDWEGILHTEMGYSTIYDELEFVDVNGMGTDTISYFGTAKYLPDWCKENALQLKIFTKTIDIEKLWRKGDLVSTKYKQLELGL